MQPLGPRRAHRGGVVWRMGWTTARLRHRDRGGAWAALRLAAGPGVRVGGECRRNACRRAGIVRRRAGGATRVAPRRRRAGQPDSHRDDGPAIDLAVRLRRRARRIRRRHRRGAGTTQRSQRDRLNRRSGHRPPPRDIRHVPHRRARHSGGLLQRRDGRPLQRRPQRTGRTKHRSGVRPRWRVAMG